MSELSTQTEGSRSSRPGRVVLLLLALCFCYVTYRALHLELINDESELLSSVHRNRYRDLVLGVDWNSQAHFLNALLAKPCVELLPINEIVASRVPSLVGLLLFLWGVWKVGTLFPTRLTRVLITLALVSNAYLLDYLAQSRGYGLALGFCVLSIFFLLKANLVPSEQNKSARKQASWAIWLAAGSALSNMAFLYFYAAALIATVWLLWRNRFKFGFHWCSSTVLLGVFYFPRILTSRKQDGLRWGGDVGFIHDTVASLVRATFYDVVVPTWLVGFLSVAVTLLVCFLAYWSYRKGINGAFTLSATTALVAVFCITANVLLAVKYPLERCALFLVPLVILDIGVVAAWSRPRWLRVALWGMLLVYTGVGLSGINLSHTQNCRSDADIASLLLDLRELHKTTGQGIQIAFSDGSKWTTWYYAEHLLGLRHSLPTAMGVYARTFEWLTLYEWRGCRHILAEPSHEWLLPGTTHLFLDENDGRLLAQFPVGKVAELKFYPASGMGLYALIKPKYRGALTFPNGEKFVGEIKDGAPNGQAVMTWPNGAILQGEWRDGKCYRVTGTEINPDGTREVGSWNHDGTKSEGTITWRDGRQYQGDWKLIEGSADLPDGTGAMTWPDGRKYVGQFRDGKMDGTGKMTYPDGKVEEGIWKQDKIEGAAQ